MDKATQGKRKKLLKNFLRTFPFAFQDETYIAWERNYKWQAHLKWKKELNQNEFKILLRKKQFSEICKRAINIESRTNLLFSFEKMALRDGVKPAAGAESFARGLFELIYGKKNKYDRIEDFITIISQLPRKQTRVLTWPIVTVFGFIASPGQFIYIKPNVTKIAAESYMYPLEYKSYPNKLTYKQFMGLANQVKKDLKAFKPKDYIDIQSFIWTLGSDEYD